MAYSLPLVKRASKVRSLLPILGAVAVALCMLGSGVASASSPTAAPLPMSSPAILGASTTVATASSSPSGPAAQVFGTNANLGATVAADEKAFAASGHNPSLIHPPNLHQAPPLSSTGGSVTPLYSIAPAPMGVGYFGLSNTTGTIQNTTVNTTSLAGTYSTGDPLGTQTEEFDVSTGSSYYDIQPAHDSYGAQLNAVLTNVTIFGQTSFYNPSDPAAPTGCPGYAGNPETGPAPCPNEFWMQNYIEYVPGNHSLQIGDEVWNFSNPTASWGAPFGGSNADENSVVGFGSVADGLYYLTNTPSEYGPTITISYPFTLALFINITRGPCHTDTVPGTGVPSCTADGSTVSTTEPVNEIFFNYSVWKTPSQPCPTGDTCTGQHVCPATEPYPGVVCGEYDDLFFNSVDPATPTVGVPAYGPQGRIGSAVIQANGSAYDPVGLTNDYEFDYGIGSDDGDTNGVAYANGTVGIDYCAQADTLPGGQCAAYSTTPAAYDFGGETGETSTGEVGYWSPQESPTGAGLFTGAGAPLAHQVTGPSLLLGLWNMSGRAYPHGSGDFPLSYAHISPANAWVGIAAGAGVTSQSQFQVAPTFGWYSYWKGSGGAPSETALGPDLYLPAGVYTIEVLLSGYNPFIGNVDLSKSGKAPVISLTRNPATGVYTPLWAFSSTDLANISTNSGGFGVGSVGNQYHLDHAAPTVGGPFGVAGSLSWLFSNLNDYLFTVWIGEFLNSTTAYAQSNPAASFLMEYPSWQYSSLNYFGVPTTDQFQLYFFHVQNFTLAGTHGIYSWANYEAFPIFSVVCNGCKNDLFAGNTFRVSDGGLELTGGGTNAPSGASVASTRNVVWGNTFAPAPQPAYPGLIPPSDSLSVTESFDRVYNNAFDAHDGMDATVFSSAAYSDWWNATCQSGYSPLSGGAYPGAIVCEPLSYSQTVNGFQLTGSIVGSHFQGGNFWAAYGNEWNPYANIPFKDRRASLTGPGGIQSTTAPFAGDYAPLITTTVYKTTFRETGLPASARATAFEVQILGAGGTPFLWYNSSATNTAPGGCKPGTICVNFYAPNGKYEFQVLSTTLSGTTYEPHPAKGTFKIVGSPAATVKIVFSAAPSAAPLAAASAGGSISLTTPAGARRAAE
ncbi:MAG: thermopsin family protease [Thermoplasmata archaeon]